MINTDHIIYVKIIVTILPQSVLAAVTNYHKPDGLNNKYLFLTILEAGSPRLRFASDSSWFIDGSLLMVPSQKGRESSLRSLLYRH